LDESWFNFSGKAVVRTISRREDGKEGSLPVMALFSYWHLSGPFGRYFQNLFTVFSGPP
jgi:hypothetical protein